MNTTSLFKIKSEYLLNVCPLNPSLKFQTYSLLPQNCFFLSPEAIMDIFDNVVTFLATILLMVVHMTSFLGEKNSLGKAQDSRAIFSFRKGLCSCTTKQPECPSQKTPPFLLGKTFVQLQF